MFRDVIILLCLSCVVGEHLQLPEGAPCSWNGVNGQCVNVHKCFGAKKDIDKKEEPPICTYANEEPVICCTDCELVNNTRLMVIDKALGVIYKTGTSKAHDKCVDYIHNLDYPCKNNKETIIKKILNVEKNCYDYMSRTQGFVYAAAGGRNARREEFRHMALLGYGDTMDTADWLCGGSVISERFILTAAHCVSTLSLGPVKYVALGILRRTDQPDIWDRYNVKRIFRHPEYKPPSKYNDIALLESNEDFVFSLKVRPACLHTDDNFDDIADATGWGALGYKKELADVLQAVRLTKFSEEECSEAYPQHRHLLEGLNHNTQVCYGDREEPKDTCEGDSGGPLQSLSHQTCVYTILGVTSYGRKCGVSGGSGVYTQVKPYVSWIEDIVWP